MAGRAREWVDLEHLLQKGRPSAGGLGRRGFWSRLSVDKPPAGVLIAVVPADVEDDHAVAFYEALGGQAAPVTMFTFEDRAHDRLDAP